MDMLLSMAILPSSAILSYSCCISNVAGGWLPRVTRQGELVFPSRAEAQDLISL
jgi:hypothetical protein